MATPDSSSISPIDIGRILAGSLDHSSKISQISEKERSMLSDAKIPIELYRRERLLLAGFAIDFAIVTLLKNSDVGKQVRGDYLETWSTIGRQNVAGAALYQLFVQRCSEYAMAVWALEAGKINTIGLTFWRFLASDNSRAMSLALTYAPSVYFSHFEAAEKLLRSARLIKPRAHC